MHNSSWSRWACALLCVQASAASSYGPFMTTLAGREDSPSWLTFNSTWHTLGPFQMGTREATWGADPLELVGGFRNLSYDPDSVFPSALPANGTASWNVTQATQTVSRELDSVSASVSLAYSNVDWDFLKVVYGWAAVQYQAWARGEFTIHGNETQHAIIHTDAILEFWLDGVHYFGGDFYTFRKAPPVLHLAPGAHRIDVRLIRDVRAFGGVLEPTIDVTVDVQRVTGSLELSKPGILVSDVVNGTLASTIASVYLRNSGVADIEIMDIQPLNTSHASSDQYVSSRFALRAGQTRPVAFNVSLPSHNSSSIAYSITYRTGNDTNLSTLQVSQELNHLSTYRPHKITFLHSSGIVSYAMLRPPAQNATCRPNPTRLPILLVLHGAGLEADNPMVTGSLDPVSNLCAWVLFPTGVTPWSGDDWHNWGFADVEAAIEAVPKWITTLGWKGQGVDINRWIVAGHSNGGQGTWYAMSHRPDKVLAAVPISGYASIQKYVSYELWQPADPRRTAVMSASLNSYRHEMLVANMQGIPTQQQHGEVDDNVPAYNSRFLAQQLYLAGGNSSYNEVKDKNHWWDTVMTTPELVKFYHEQVANQEPLPRRLEHFSITVGDPGDMGSKNGIRVLHLMDPGQYGRVDVSGHTIRTSNVQDLEFDPTVWSGPLRIDGQIVRVRPSETAPAHVVKVGGTTWDISSHGPSPIPSQSQRHGRQLGSMTAVLRSQGPFILQHSGSTNTSHLALQISRNLHQYFQADAIIDSSGPYQLTGNSLGNTITLAVGSDPGGSANHAVRVDESGVTIRDHAGHDQRYGEEARGAAFLRPLDGERLELLLWGADDDGLRQAARLVPMLTGVGQPDFAIFGSSAQWKGVEGVLAMGFFDSEWRVTASSMIGL